jgi:hypothetical protein
MSEARVESVDEGNMSMPTMYTIMMVTIIIIGLKIHHIRARASSSERRCVIGHEFSL